MRFVHRIGLRATASQKREMESLGVTLPAGIGLPGELPSLAFDIDEQHPSWPKLEKLFAQWRVSDVLRTEFSDAEVNASPWLEISAWHHGYPQPEDEYLPMTYDVTEWCKQCGTGKKQRAPFRMAGEPKWAKNSVLQLIWIYEELFVKPEVWSEIFKPHSIDCRPVLNTKNVELKTVVQLVITDTVGIVTTALPSEHCLRCQRIKYLPVVRGAFPALSDQPSGSLARTSEYFGSGGQSDRRIIVSQELRRSLNAANVRGAAFTPVQAS
jgi:hypothetical protein